MNRKIALATALSVLMIGSATFANAQSQGETRAQPRVDAAELHDGTRQSRRAETTYPLERIIADATRRYPGTVTEVDLDDGRYEIEIRQRNGREVELDYSARTGELLHTKYD